VGGSATAPAYLEIQKETGHVEITLVWSHFRVGAGGRRLRRRDHHVTPSKRIAGGVSAGGVSTGGV
jgi:hypothetical protein